MFNTMLAVARSNEKSVLLCFSVELFGITLHNVNILLPTGNWKGCNRNKF